jgi:hypothetical protein
MGQLFQRTYKATDGTVKTCRTWTIRYHRNGRPLEESTKYTRKGDAHTLLKLREGDLAKGMPINPAQFKLTFEDAAKTVVDDFRANGRAITRRRPAAHYQTSHAVVRWPAPRGHQRRFRAGLHREAPERHHHDSEGTDRHCARRAA